MIAINELPKGLHTDIHCYTKLSFGSSLQTRSFEIYKLYIFKEEDSSGINNMIEHNKTYKLLGTRYFIEILSFEC